MMRTIRPAFILLALILGTVRLGGWAHFPVHHADAETGPISTACMGTAVPWSPARPLWALRAVTFHMGVISGGLGGLSRWQNLAGKLQNLRCGRRNVPPQVLASNPVVL